MSPAYDLVSQAEASETRVPERWAGTRACCLAHHRQMFWLPIWSCWVHSAGLRPCEAMEGEGDPEFLPCRYCGTALQVDGAGRMWSLVPEKLRHPHWEYDTVYVWLPPRTVSTWIDDAWTEKCPVSPTFHHEVTRLGHKSLGVS